MQIDRVNEIEKEYKQTLISLDPASQMKAVHTIPELVKEIKRLRKAMEKCHDIIVGTKAGYILNEAMDG